MSMQPGDLQNAGVLAYADEGLYMAFVQKVLGL